jgi:CheY-like chemotaxis protein
VNAIERAKACLGLMLIAGPDTVARSSSTHGEVVGPATTLDGALEMLERDSEFGGVVLDMNLNGESALPVADALRARAIPFLILSGYGAEVLAEAHRHVPILSKPFDPARLVEVLRGIVVLGIAKP